MKTALFLFCFTCFGISGYSQLNETYKNKKLTPAIKKPGFKLTTANENSSENLVVVQQKDKRNEMPVLKLASKGVFRENNGRGSDVYIYEPDNMPCLKPDATFHSNMPTGKLPVARNQGLIFRAIIIRRGDFRMS